MSYSKGAVTYSFVVFLGLFTIPQLETPRLFKPAQSYSGGGAGGAVCGGGAVVQHAHSLPLGCPWVFDAVPRAGRLGGGCRDLQPSVDHQDHRAGRCADAAGAGGEGRRMPHTARAQKFVTKGVPVR